MSDDDERDVETAEGYDLGPGRIMGSIYTRTRYPGHSLLGVFIARLEDDVIDPEALPGTLPNHAVAPLVQCVLGVPASAQVDSPGVLRGACRGRLRLRDYTGRFRIAKRLALKAARGLGVRGAGGG